MASSVADAHYDRVFELLEAANLPNQGRGHHKKSKDGVTRKGVTLGMTLWGNVQNTPMDYAVHNETFSDLFDALVDMMRDLDPEFPWTSIQLNKNVQTDVHQDISNYGYSRALSLGSFTGGRILQYKNDEKVKAYRQHVLKHPTDTKTLNRLRGEMTVVKKIDTFRNLSLQDGRQWHSTEPYEGEPRYSMIFYYNEAYLVNRAMGERDPPFAMDPYEARRKGTQKLYIKSPISFKYPTLRIVICSYNRPQSLFETRSRIWLTAAYPTKPLTFLWPTESKSVGIKNISALSRKASNSV